MKQPEELAIAFIKTIELRLHILDQHIAESEDRLHNQIKSNPRLKLAERNYLMKLKGAREQSARYVDQFKSDYKNFTGVEAKTNN